MRIGYNEAAETAMRHYAFHIQKIGDSTVRLASGKKLLKDDPAAVIVSNRLQARLREMAHDMRKNEDMQDELNAVASTLQGERNLLQRMRELALQMNSDTATEYDKNLAFAEYAELAKEFGETMESRTGMNIVVLDSGSGSEQFLFEKDGKVFSNGQWVNTDQYLKTLDELLDADAILAEEALKEVDALEIDAPALPEDAAGEKPKKDPNDRFSRLIDHVDRLLNSNLMSSAGIGAAVNRLQEELEFLALQSDIATEMLSRTEDVDFAKELVALVKEKLLAQVSTAIAAQANTLPENVVFLLDTTGSTTFSPAAQAVREA